MMSLNRVGCVVIAVVLAVADVVVVAVVEFSPLAAVIVVGVLSCSNDSSDRSSSPSYRFVLLVGPFFSFIVSFGLVSYFVVLVLSFFFKIIILVLINSISCASSFYAVYVFLKDY